MTQHPTIHNDDTSAPLRSGEAFSIPPGQTITDFLISQAGDLWERYIEHPFVIQLRDGTLPLEAFIHFLRQGYLYLLHYARVYALAAYKARTFDEISASMTVVQNCINEVQVNARLCELQGITKEELVTTKQSNAGIAYSRYILDIASAGDLLDLTVATTPCLIGYGEMGKRLLTKSGHEAECSDKNRYYTWASAYAQQEYQTAVETGRAALEELAKPVVSSQERLQGLVTVFRQATELEIAFWDSALASAR